MTWRWLSFEALELSQLYQVVQLREAVFVVEQECAYLDADGRDRGAHHLLGVRDGALVAYLRAFAPGADGEACLGRVVVAASARGIGLGRDFYQVQSLVAGDLQGLLRGHRPQLGAVLVDDAHFPRPNGLVHPSLTSRSVRFGPTPSRLSISHRFASISS